MAKKAMKKIVKSCWYFVEGKRVAGTHPDIRGDVSECDLSASERKIGVDIKDLIAE